REGFLVDIGGGSTEITLFRDRAIVHSVSLPFGAVNTTKRFVQGGLLDEDSRQHIRAMVETALQEHPWIRGHAGLPLVCLGGTTRNACKLVQRGKAYSIPQNHNYCMAGEDIDQLLDRLAPLTVEQRKKIDGMSKDRADLLPAGIAILQTIFGFAGASHYVVSGAGLRDGLFYETVNPGKQRQDDVLGSSVAGLLALHSSMPMAHVAHTNRLALKLYDHLQSLHQLEPRSRVCLDVASQLFRIGVTVSYYNYAKHTYYLMLHSRI